MKTIKVNCENHDAYQRVLNALLKTTNTEGISVKLEEEDIEKPKIMQCDCVTKSTEIPGLLILYVSRTCPVHGKHWKI
jgi:hypothetical protein